MKLKYLRDFLDFLMKSDPWPLNEGESKQLRDFANNICKQQGYTDWIDAYHKVEGDN